MMIVDIPPTPTLKNHTHPQSYLPQCLPLHPPQEARGRRARPTLLWLLLLRGRGLGLLGGRPLLLLLLLLLPSPLPPLLLGRGRGWLLLLLLLLLRRGRGRGERGLEALCLLAEEGVGPG